MQRRSIKVLLVVSLMVVMAVIAGCGENKAANQQTPPDSASPDNTVTDMAGRTVVLPKEIETIVTLGPVPVLNGIVFTMGEGDKIINGLPDRFGKSPRWKYQKVFAPHLEGQPEMQGAGHEPEIETILQHKPDVIITMNREAVDPLEQRGLNVVFLSWKAPDDVKEAVTILGEVFNKPERAKKYIDYWDATISRVERTLAQVPEEQRVKALYSDIVKLTQPHLIAEWWIEMAGGVSVSNDGREAETLQFTVEHLLQWQPEVIFLTSSEQIEEAMKDPRLADIPAIKNNRLYVPPTGAHIWANRTAEQPLTVLWAAKTMYPEEFKDLDFDNEVMTFYKEFFGYDLSAEQLEEMLSGKL